MSTIDPLSRLTYKKVRKTTASTSNRSAGPQKTIERVVGRIQFDAYELMLRFSKELGVSEIISKEVFPNTVLIFWPLSDKQKIALNSLVVKYSFLGSVRLLPLEPTKKKVGKYSY